MDQIGIFSKLVKSFGFAWEGISYTIKTQRNFKIQIFIGFFALVIACLLKFSRFEYIILLLCICLVLSAELFNTAMEALVDFKTAEYHPKAKIAKDVSAGVVLLISFFVAVVGLFLFVPHLI